MMIYDVCVCGCTPPLFPENLRMVSSLTNIQQRKLDLSHWLL